MMSRNTFTISGSVLIYSKERSLKWSRLELFDVKLKSIYYDESRFRRIVIQKKLLRVADSSSIPILNHFMLLKICHFNDKTFFIQSSK